MRTYINVIEMMIIDQDDYQRDPHHNQWWIVVNIDTW